jgi:hypothetical protein
MKLAVKFSFRRTGRSLKRYQVTSSSHYLISCIVHARAKYKTNKTSGAIAEDTYLNRVIIFTMPKQPDT